MKDYDNVYDIYNDLVQIFRLIPDYAMEPGVLGMWREVTHAVHAAVLRVEGTIFTEVNDDRRWNAWSRDLEVSDV